ncbi:MAG: hypothetical protein FWG49_00805 [Leptospirales bacterium]|nr:hypothetical protein [Leptospirales bacterium]
MTENKNRLDSNSIVSKLKELILILVFTLIAAAVAIILSDILVFPLTYYSISNIDIFNIAFKYAFISFITATFLLILFFKVRSLYKDENSIRDIIKYIILKPVQYLGFILLSLIIVIALIAILYIIFSNNYYLLYKLSGGI